MSGQGQKANRLHVASGLPMQQCRQLLNGQGGRRRAKRWLADPCCHWCNRHTTLAMGPDGMPAETTATLDHLKSRPMGRLAREYTPKLLACRRCNRLRAEIQSMLDLGQVVPPECRAVFTRNQPPELLTGFRLLDLADRLDDPLFVPFP